MAVSASCRYSYPLGYRLTSTQSHDTVVVRAGQSGTVVEALDANVMVNVPGNEALRPIADEAASRINAAMDTLTS